MTSLAKAGIVLGLGLGGFLDGIVLHQILGWHHLICTTETCQVDTVAALRQQVTEDGFFHLATWMLTATGAGQIFTAARAGTDAPAWSGYTLVGAALCGWGAFNLIEGTIDHQILGIHHVRPGDPHSLMWDMMFLASGVALIATGAVLVNRGRRLAAAPMAAARSARGATR